MQRKFTRQFWFFPRRRWFVRQTFQDFNHASFSSPKFRLTYKQHGKWKIGENRAERATVQKSYLIHFSIWSIFPIWLIFSQSDQFFQFDPFSPNLIHFFLGYLSLVIKECHQKKHTWFVSSIILYFPLLYRIEHTKLKDACPTLFAPNKKNVRNYFFT